MMTQGSDRQTHVVFGKDMAFDLTGAAHIQTTPDGIWVVGEKLLIPTTSQDEAKKLCQEYSHLAGGETRTQGRPQGAGSSRPTVG